VLQCLALMMKWCEEFGKLTKDQRFTWWAGFRHTHKGTLPLRLFVWGECQGRRAEDRVAQPDHRRCPLRRDLGVPKKGSSAASS
jgi:hypothetical protein